MPRTISSSAVRAQSSATRFRRKVLPVVGRPVLRMTAFQVPEGFLTIVGMDLDQRLHPSTVPKSYRTRISGGSDDFQITRKPA